MNHSTAEGIIQFSFILGYCDENQQLLLENVKIVKDTDKCHLPQKNYPWPINILGTYCTSTRKLRKHPTKPKLHHTSFLHASQGVKKRFTFVSTYSTLLYQVPLLLYIILVYYQVEIVYIFYVFHYLCHMPLPPMTSHKILEQLQARPSSFF